VYGVDFTTLSSKEQFCPAESVLEGWSVLVKRKLFSLCWCFGKCMHYLYALQCSRHTSEDVASYSELQRLIMRIVELIFDPESEHSFN